MPASPHPPQTPALRIAVLEDDATLREEILLPGSLRLVSPHRHVVALTAPEHEMLTVLIDHAPGTYYLLVVGTEPFANLNVLGLYQ